MNNAHKLRKPASSLLACLFVFVSTFCHKIEFTSSEIIRDLYLMMKDAHEILQKNEISYWAFGGTLLGIVRHGGVIPWDDDIDIVIHDFSKEIFLKKIIPDFEALNYKIITQKWGFQVFKNRQILENRQMSKYPAHIDIAFHIKKEDIYCYPGNVGMSQKRYFFRCSEVYPLKKYKFGDIEIMGPNDPIPYLNRAYPTWQTEAVMYNHTITKPLIIPLTEDLLKPAEYSGELENQVKIQKQKNIIDLKSIIIQEADENDAEIISKLLGQLGFLQESATMSLDKIKLFAQSDNDKVWIAKSNDTIIGLLALNVITPFYYPDKFARVDMIVVDEQYRNQGVGKLLMKHAEEYALSLCCQRLFLTSGNHRPEAHAFYKNIGYVNNATYFVKYLGLTKKSSSLGDIEINEINE